MWTRMRSWLERKRGGVLTPPPGPSPEQAEEARRAARDAADVLSEVLSHGPEVDALSAKSERIHRQNNLGPSFWRVMGEGKV